MADNLQLSEATGTGAKLATAVLTFSGDEAHIQEHANGILSGSEGSWVFTQSPGGAGNVTDGTPRVTLAADDPAVVDLAAIEVLLTGIDVDTDAIKTDAAAIEVLLTTMDGRLTTIDTDTGAIATSAASIDGKITACNTGDVTVSASALPSGAATEANQATLIGHVDGIETLLAGGLPAALGAGGGLKIDGSGTAIPVSGTFWQATQPVSGTVTANLSATDNAVLDDIAAKLGTIDSDTSNMTSAFYSTGAGPGSDQVCAVVVNSITAGDNNIGNVDIVTLPSGNLGQRAMAASLSVVPASDITDATYIGDIKFGESLPAGTATIGDVGLKPRTSGGYTISRTIGAATTNATSVKASAGQVYGIYVSNINAAPVYLKLYNLAAAPTVGTDTPVATFMVPGSTAGAGFTFWPPAGIAFSTGIAFALTGAVGDADTTAVSANEQVVHIFYS